MKKGTSPRQTARKTGPWPTIVIMLAIGAFLGTTITTAFQQGAVPGGGSSQDGNSLESQIALNQAQAAQNPNDVHAWVTLGNLYFDTGKPVESIDAYRKALALEPGNPNVLTDMGVMHRQLGQFQEALEAFRLATAADPAHQVSRLNTGIVLLYDMKDTPEALRAWEGLLQINPAAQTSDGTPLAVLVASLKVAVPAGSAGQNGQTQTRQTPGVVAPHGDAS